MAKRRRTARLTVLRGGADGKSCRQTFEVPFEPGQSLLDGLRWVRVHLDPSLTFRFSCTNANACKECLILIDGVPAYACTTRLRPGEMVLSPLANKPLIRDLFTDLASPAERLTGTCPHE